MLQIGTCASGGPYVSARQCPGGTGVLGLMIPGLPGPHSYTAEVPSGSLPSDIHATAVPGS